MAGEYGHKITPKLRTEATDLFGKFAKGGVMNRNQVKEAFASADLNVTEKGLDFLIHCSVDLSGGEDSTDDEDSSVEDITLDEFINIMSRKKSYDEWIAKIDKQASDVTKEEVEQVIGEIYGKEAADESMSDIVWIDECVDYIILWQACYDYFGAELIYW